jgi:threonine dehydratase
MTPGTTAPFTIAELDRAAALVGRFVPPTPQYAWPMLAEVAGTEVWVKHENHTPTGAFKVRGGLVYVDRHLAEARRLGVEPRSLISATRGNHGQSLAFAGRAFGVGVTIVVPHGNSPDKNAAMRAFGATLVEAGNDFQAAREHAEALAVEQKLHMVHSFDPALVLGVATYAREFLTAAALDVVYVPVGMGSGICAHIAVRDLLGLATEIVGVVAERAPATALSFAAGHVVNTETAATFIDGVACRAPDPAAIRAIVAGASRIVQVSDDACAEAMRILFRTTHNLPEPSGAAALAGLLAERDVQAGKRVGVTMSGGNADAGPLMQVLAGTTPTV